MYRTVYCTVRDHLEWGEKGTYPYFLFTRWKPHKHARRALATPQHAFHTCQCLDSTITVIGYIEANGWSSPHNSQVASTPHVNKLFGIYATVITYPRLCTSQISSMVKHRTLRHWSQHIWAVLCKLPAYFGVSPPPYSVEASHMQYRPCPSSTLPCPYSILGTPTDWYSTVYFGTTT